MKRTIAIIAALAGSAHAAPIVTGPPGWKGAADPDLVTATGALPHFGAGAHGVIEAERYAPAEPGVVLYVTRVAANTADRDASARAELDALRGTRPDSIEDQPWQEHTDPDNRVEGTIGWRDPSTHVHFRSRIVIAATADRIAAVVGECMAADDAAQVSMQACTAALATLDTGIASAERVALHLPASVPAAPATTSTSSSPTMKDGSHTPLPPIAVAHDEQPASDRRPVYVGLGLVALAAVFWWNRRRREQFEREGQADDR